MSDKYPLDRIAEVFADELPGWAIVYIGGEPFVYRDFAELNRRLAKTNTIGLYSNLSIEDNIRRFADEVSPDRVTFLNCGLHIAERIQRDPGAKQFLTLYRLLRERGFPAAITYIMHPSVVDRAEADVLHFADLGAKVYLKVFRGIYDGVVYPEAYSQKVIELIERHEPPIQRGEAVRAHMTGEGATCRAGMLLLDMDVDGNVYRCLTDRSLQRDCLGNLFHGTFRLRTSPALCRNEDCLSARQGLGFSLSKFRSMSSPRSGEGTA